MDMNVVALKTEGGTQDSSVYVTLGEKDGFRVAFRPILRPTKDNQDGGLAMGLMVRIRVTETNPDLPFDVEKAKEATGLKYLYSRPTTDSSGCEHGSVTAIRGIIKMPFSVNEATEKVLGMGLGEELADFLYETLTLPIEPERAKLVEYVNAVLDKAFPTVKTELVEDKFTLIPETEEE